MEAVCAKFRGADIPCLGPFGGTGSSHPPPQGLGALLSPLGTGVARLPPPWRSSSWGPNQGDYKREEPPPQQPCGFLKLSTFLAARAVVQAWRLSPFGVAAGFSGRATRAGAGALPHCRAPLPLNERFLLPQPAAAPARSSSFLYFKHFAWENPQSLFPAGDL